MDGHTFVSWNIPNFITVSLMALVGFAIYSAGMAAYTKQQANQ